jgi:hypothetical protein
MIRPVFAVATLAIFHTSAALAGPLTGLQTHGQMGSNPSDSDPWGAAWQTSIDADGIIGPSQELVWINPWVYADFSDDGDQVTIGFNSSFTDMPFNGVRIEVPDADPFTDVTINPATDIRDFDTTRLFVNGNSLAVNMEGLSVVGVVVLDLIAGEPSPRLEIAGVCPGTTILFADTLTPNGNIAVLKGSGLGASIIPAGPCAGVEAALDNMQLHTIASADAAGTWGASPSVGPGVCDKAVQILDIATCTLSNAAAFAP